MSAPALICCKCKTPLRQGSTEPAPKGSLRGHTGVSSFTLFNCGTCHKTRAVQANY